jgi:hypothetical protein
MFSECLNKSVADLLRQKESIGSGVAVPWYFFNSSGQEKKEDGLVIERFTKYVDDPNRHIKTIVQPEHTIDCIGNPHVYYYSKGEAVYMDNSKHNKDGQCGGAINNPVYLTETLRINHYVTMSKEEYEIKMNKGLLDDSTENIRRAHTDEMWLSLHPEETTWKTDNSLSKYVDVIKKNMKERYEKSSCI